MVEDVKSPPIFSCASCEHLFTPQLDLAPEQSSNLPSSISYYEVLGVGRNATAEEISRAYRKKSLKCHPDRTKDREHEWEQLAKAYEILGDKRKRHWYNIELESGTTSLDAPEDAVAQGIAISF